MEKKHVASFKRTDYPTVFQKRDDEDITFTGSSRIFHREVGGTARTAAGERPEGVAAGHAWPTVVLSPLTLVVVCAAFGEQMGGPLSGLQGCGGGVAWPAIYRWPSRTCVSEKVGNYQTTTKSHFGRAPDTGVGWGQVPGLFWKEDSWPQGWEGTLGSVTSEQPRGEQATPQLLVSGEGTRRAG